MTDKKIVCLFADWKEASENFIEQLKEKLPELGLSVVDHPDAAGTNFYGLIVSSAPLTQKEIDEFRYEKPQ